MNIKLAKEYSKEFNSMPDRFKELYMEMIYFMAIENENNMRVFVDVIGLPKDCESPIEQILWMALNFCTLNSGKNYYFYEQAEVEANGNKYRLDFLYEEDYMDRIDNPLLLAIECDGHDFHEKTKEQVEKRNKRDMDLKLAGYDILHYSGSQIYKNPIKCAMEILDYIDKKVGEKQNG